MGLVVVWYAKASQTALCTHKPPKLSFSGVLLWADQRLHGLLLSVITAKASHAGKQEK
jgi:hypothetical protein